MPSTEDWTVGRLLTWTTDYLKSHGSDAPRLDAEILLADARQCERIQLYTAYETTVGEEVRNRFRELVKERAQGMPVAYLVGHREFYSLPFFVSPAVLIPRPETEHLVIAALDLLREHYRQAGRVHIADVGTGSGVVAVCLAREWSECRVLGIDTSCEALEIARRNVERHEVGQQVTLVKGHLLQELPTEPRFDVIVSNPPYVSESEYESLDRQVREFEPREALVGGTEGSELTLRLIDQAAERLHDRGWLALETSPMLAPRLSRYLEKTGVYDAVGIQKDLAGHPRILIARRRSR